MTTRKVAAAEGMPEKINRRSALMMGASLAATSIAAATVGGNNAHGGEPTEHPWVKARRLARELSDTLSQCDDGTMMAEVFPLNDGGHHSFMFVDAQWRQEKSAENRLNYHARAYARAARDIDPTAEQLWMGRAVDDDNSGRFFLTVSRLPATAKGEA